MPRTRGPAQVGLLLVLGALAPGRAHAAVVSTTERPVAQDVSALLDDRARVRVEPAVDTAYPGQLVPLIVVVEVEARFLAEDLLQVFRRAVDLPLQLEWGSAPGLSPWPAADARLEAARPADQESASLSLGDALARLPVRRVERDGRTFVRLELVRHVIPREPGVLALPAARLRFAFATRFREDWLAGRVPEDRREADLTSPPTSLLVLALPTLGRPDGFTGAVGPLELTTELDRERGTYGEPVQLAVELRGPGDLEAFPAPVPQVGEDWTLLGVLEGREPGLRRTTYELLPRRGGELVLPGVSLWVFEPEPFPAYLELAAPERVVAVDGGPPEGADPGLAGGGRPTDPAARRARTSARLLAWGLFAAACLAALLLVGVRRSEDEGSADSGPLPPPARPPHDRDPLATLLEQVPRDADAAVRDRGLRRYLAVRLGLPEARVAADGLAARWEAAGLDLGQLDATRQVLLDLRRARYAGEAPEPIDLPDVRALARALEAGRRI